MRESFEKYFDATKDTLLKKGKFVFHKFLARAFIFTVVTVDNRVGKDSIKQISNDYINSFIKDKDTIQLSDEYEIQNIKSMAIESMDKGTLPVFSASEQILETFNKAIHAYNIIDFVNSDPMISLQANLLFGAIDFVEDINLKVVRKFFENQDEKTYKNVKAFAETLKSYNSCLGHHMEPHQGDINTFIPFYRGTHFKPEQGVDYEPNVTFENEVLNYRRALDSIYSKLFDGKSLII